MLSIISGPVPDDFRQCEYRLQLSRTGEVDLFYWPEPSDLGAEPSGDHLFAQTTKIRTSISQPKFTRAFRISFRSIDFADTFRMGILSSFLFRTSSSSSLENLHLAPASNKEHKLWTSLHTDHSNQRFTASYWSDLVDLATLYHYRPRRPESRAITEFAITDLAITALHQHLRATLPTYILSQLCHNVKSNERWNPNTNDR